MELFSMSSLNLRHVRKQLKAIKAFRDRRVDRAFHKRPIGTPSSVNDCWKPNAGASKADLVEFHAENMRSRRARQRRGGTTVLPKASTSIALGNRHIRNIKTGVPYPHQHEREIARRKRRA
jgi:hypothetical protein